MINRRRLLVGLPLGTLAAPWVRGQSKPKVIGVLNSYSSQENDLPRAKFLKAMSQLGYIRDKHFVLAERFADGSNDRLPQLAAELVKLNVDVILADATPAAVAASKATTSIPILFNSVSDPVRIGLADSLAHPGHNSTGLANFSGDLGPKRLELLKQMVPGLTHVASLRNPTNPNTAKGSPGILAAAEQLGLHFVPFNVSSPKDIEPAFRAIPQQGVQAVYIQADTLLWEQRRTIVELALKFRLPSACPFAAFVEVGGLMSYGVDPSAAIPEMANYVDKIFRGAKPSDLPIQQPTQIDLVINRKTADALQLTIPRSLLVQAHEVIG